MAKIAPSKTTKNRTPGAKLFPVGDAIVEINWVEETVSKEKGTPRVSFRLKGSAPEPVIGMYINEDCYLDERSVWKLEELAKAVDVKEEFDTSDTDQMVKLFVGKKFIIRVAKDEYKDKNGELRESRKITSYRKIKAKKASEEEGNAQP